MSSKTFLLCLFLIGYVCLVAGGVSSGGRSFSGSHYTGLASANSGMRAGVNSNVRRGAYYSGGQNGVEGARKDGAAPTTPVVKSSRISAWGIISIIMFIILIGAGAYYGSICYPFFCKKDNEYDIMNMSSTTTATPTRSTEFEKLENYCSRSTTSSRSNDTGISNI